MKRAFSPSDILDDPEIKTITLELGHTVARLRHRAETLSGVPISLQAIVGCVLRAMAETDEKSLATVLASQVVSLATVRALRPPR